MVAIVVILLVFTLTSAIIISVLLLLLLAPWGRFEHCGDDFKLESGLQRRAAQVSMASMESMAMVAAVQCDGNGSICFNSAAKAHVACTVPRITNHATTFGIAHNCSLWSHDCHRSASWPTTAVYRGQRTCAHAAWQIFCCMNHIKLARDQLAKRGGIRI